MLYVKIKGDADLYLQPGRSNVIRQIMLKRVISTKVPIGVAPFVHHIDEVILVLATVRRHHLIDLLI